MAGGPNYAEALRCIGQDLASRGLRAFDLSTDGAKYIVECGYQEPPAATPVTLHYTAADLEQLDRAGRRNRNKSPQSADFLTLPQIFRAIGGFLDKSSGFLLRISNNRRNAQEFLFTIEYETAEGERVVDDRPGSTLYDMCVSMYKQRGKGIGALKR
jgi:hypothetical protein